MRKWGSEFFSSRSEDPKTFIIRIKEGRSVLAVPEYVILQVFPFFLSEVALQWFFGMRYEWLIFADFFQSFRSRFDDPEFKFKLRQEIYNWTFFLKNWAPWIIINSKNNSKTLKSYCWKRDVFDCAEIRARVFRLPVDCSNKLSYTGVRLGAFEARGGIYCETPPPPHNVSHLHVTHKIRGKWLFSNFKNQWTYYELLNTYWTHQARRGPGQAAPLAPP